MIYNTFILSYRDIQLVFQSDPARHQYLNYSVIELVLTLNVLSALFCFYAEK